MLNLATLSGLLPFVGLGLTIIFFSAHSRYAFEGMIKGAIVWGWLLIFATHILSIFESLSYLSLAVFWILYIVVFAILLYKNDMSFRYIRPIFTLSSIILYISLLLTLAVALLYPRNTWDSMTYYMPKVVHMNMQIILSRIFHQRANKINVNIYLHV
jgi:sensor histidine kinase YesM